MTATKEELLALAERVEGLDGSDREVDAAIAHLTCWRWDGWDESDLRIEDRPLDQVIHRIRYSCNSIFTNLPRYTGSIDAAAELVPKNHEWLRKCPRTMTVYAVPTDAKAWALHHDATAATPALALTAAALRAQGELVV